MYEVRTYIDGKPAVAIGCHSWNSARSALLSEMHNWLMLNGGATRSQDYHLYIGDGCARIAKGAGSVVIAWEGRIVDNVTFPDVPDDALVVMVSSDFSYHPRAFASWRLAYDALCQLVSETAKHELAEDINRAIAACESDEKYDVRRVHYAIYAGTKPVYFAVTHGFVSHRFYIVTPEEGNE